jgi:probable HAF family extracellular repeat protein
LDTRIGFNSSEARAINDSGQIAGSLVSFDFTAGYQTRPVVWNGTTPTFLDAPTRSTFGFAGEARAINNAGQVAGNINENDRSRAVIWNGTTATVLGTLGAISSEANGINNAGQVVGGLKLGADRAVLWNGTTPILLNTVGFTSVAYGINNVGQVVGRAAIGGATGYAVLWTGSAETNLNTVLDNSDGTWDLQAAYGINDSGQIVGGAYNSRTNETHAFLLTPTSTTVVPLPATFPLILGGLCLLTLFSRRGKIVKS